MKFSCDLQLLSEAVNNVSLAISTRTSTIPSLEGVLLQCDGGQLRLTGFDLDMGICHSIAVEMEQPGAIVLNAQLFGEMLRKMGGPFVNIATDERQMTLISDGDTEYHILGISQDEYPSIPTVENGNPVSMRAATLKRMIAQTLFAAAQNMAQSPILCGSMFDIKNGVLNLVSVDGYRVALCREPLSGSSNMQFVVPAKTLQELSKLLPEDDEQQIDIQVSKRHALFEVGGYHIVTRLLEGDYIDYNAAIPQESTTTVVIDPKTLNQGIERVSILVTNKTSVVMRAQKNKISLQCESTLGKVNDRFEADILGNDLPLIAFNNRYMMDALKHADAAAVKIEMNGPVMPIKITPTEGDQFLFLVLPVRLKSE